MAALFCRRMDAVRRVAAKQAGACLFWTLPGGGRRGQKLRPAAGRGLR